MRIAFVVQRYGAEVTGGSESLARAVAERLARQDTVVVYTTCARDYVTWRDEYPPGTVDLGGVEVRRFAVRSERDLESFNALSDELYARAPSRDEELHWLERQGPDVPELVAALERDRDDYDAIVFFTYLYYPTYWGLAAAPERSLLVPTTHDEPPLRFGVFAELFSRACGFAFLTPPEAALVAERFGVGQRPHAVTGIGLDIVDNPDVEAFRIHHDLPGPYVLYAGRIDAGKGCAELLDYFERYRRDVRGGAELILIGGLSMPEPRTAGTRYLGYLSDEMKHAALAGASAVACPSPYESLSIVLLEGMAQGTPAIVNARSPVLLDHCRRSQAGLYYRDGEEFLECVDILVTQPRLRDALGVAGRRYVDREYRWDVVIGRYRDLITAVSGR